MPEGLANQSHEIRKGEAVNKPTGNSLFLGHQRGRLGQDRKRKISPLKGRK
jgi:hypothetical protein